jgi:hypothetical protein
LLGAVLVTAEYRLEVVQDAGRYITTLLLLPLYFNEVNEFGTGKVSKCSCFFGERVARASSWKSCFLS